MGKWYDYIECSANETFRVDAQRILRSDVEQLVINIQPAICLFGLLTNITFLVVIFRTKTMHTNTNAYLVNLSIADLIYLISTTIIEQVTGHTSPFTRDQGWLGPAGCYITTFLYYLTFYTSILLVTVISFERYLAVCYPFVHRRMASKGRTNKTIFVCWVMSALLSIPLMVRSSKFFYECVSFPKEFSHLPTVIGYCIPSFPMTGPLYMSLDFVFEVLIFYLCLLCK